MNLKPIAFKVVATSVLPLCLFTLKGEVTLPKILTDHMVIQRERPVHVWGQAAPGESVTVRFRGDTRTATADKLGRWSAFLPPGREGGPFTLAVEGRNRIQLTDILVGDVWIASGQSNMEWPVGRSDNGEEEGKAARHPRIRLFRVEHRVSDYPLEDVDAAPWVECSPESVADFSAVAYFFGRDLETRLNIPIGLIESNWGGTPVDAWTSLDAIARDASLMPAIAAWAAMMNAQSSTLLEQQRRIEEWRRSVQAAEAKGTPPPGQPWFPNMENSWQPAGLYNAMIAPLTRFPIRGAIWYQGESNASADRSPIYARLFQTMILDWRRAWDQGDFPFLFVQLANYKTSPESTWPELREAQLQTLGLTKTGMAVAIDIGNPDDIHPRNKQVVGKRLALAARAIEYGEGVEYSGPLFRQAVPEEGTIRVYFEHAASGLVARGGELKGFEISGADGRFQPAAAVIDGTSLVVSSPSVSAPIQVRYGWADNPSCNLYNADGLPASPFRSRP